MIKEAWGKVSKETIANCWKHAGKELGIKSRVIDLEKKQLICDINNELKKIDFNKYLDGKQITAEQLIEIDTRVETCEDLTNQEIFDLAMRKEVEEENVILEKEEDIISNKDAFLSIEKLFKYFEQKDDFNDEVFSVSLWL